MLTNNQRFQKEYDDFAKKISMITDEKVKNALNLLLKKLLEEVRQIDQKHEEAIRGTRLATDSLSAHRSSLSNLRQQIAKKIASCEQAGLIR